MSAAAEHADQARETALCAARHRDAAGEPDWLGGTKDDAERNADATRWLAAEVRALRIAVTAADLPRPRFHVTPARIGGHPTEGRP